MDHKLLVIYLNDHRAGMVAERAVAERSAGSNRERPLGSLLAEHAAAVRAEQDAVDALLERLGGRIDPVKSAGAWMAEKLGRLKPNDRVLEYSPLSRVLELEGLVGAARLRAELWANLGHIAADVPAVGGAGYDQRRTSAEQQIERLQAALRVAMAEVVAAAG